MKHFKFFSTQRVPTEKTNFFNMVSVEVFDETVEGAYKKAVDMVAPGCTIWTWYEVTAKDTECHSTHSPA